MILHAMSGTTGKPQPLMFSPRTREVHKVLLARAYTLKGMPATDMVNSVYGHRPLNGGHSIHEAVIHHTGATFISAGTGVETPSIKQVEFIRDLGATVIVGFADYIKRMEGFLGRSDNMIKLRDINVFPQSLSSILGESPGFNGEFLFLLTCDASGRENLLASVEPTQLPSEALRDKYQVLLKQKLGVKVQVKLVTSTSITSVETRQKPICMIDKR